MVQAVIVAAGSGSRLYPLTDVIPKAMIPIGKSRTPLLELIIKHCVKHGIKDFVFCLNSETGKQIKNYFGDGERFGISIKYSYSDSPQGTAGEIRKAFLDRIITLPALVYYGDTLISTDLTKLMEQHKKRKADVTTVVSDTVRIPYGVIVDREGRMERVVEKPTLPELIGLRTTDAGAIASVYYVTVMDFFTHYCDVGKDVSGGVLPEMMNDGYKMFTYHDNGDFIDVGNWKSYFESTEWNI